MWLNFLLLLGILPFRIDAVFHCPLVCLFAVICGHIYLAHARTDIHTYRRTYTQVDVYSQSTYVYVCVFHFIYSPTFLLVVSYVCWLHICFLFPLSFSFFFCNLFACKNVNDNRANAMAQLTIMVIGNIYKLSLGHSIWSYVAIYWIMYALRENNVFDNPIIYFIFHMPN